MPLLLPPPPPPFFGRPAAVGSVVSETLPIRVHWDEEGSRARAEETLYWVEVAWEAQVDGLGFPPPVLPDGDDGGIDGPEFDVYLTGTLTPFEAWAWSDAYRDQVAGDGWMSTYAYVAMSPNLPDDQLATYTVHEFNHVLQHAIDYTETSYNFWEASATAAQHWTLGADGFWEEYAADFQATPWLSAITGDGYWLYHHDDRWSYFEYGAAFWILHLDYVLGAGDGASLPALWFAAAQEGLTTEPDVVDAVVEVSGLTLGAFMNTLARSRWLVGGEWDDRGVPGLDGWDVSYQVPLDGVIDALPAEYDFAIPPHVLGQAFVEVPLDGAAGTVTVGVDSAGGRDSALMVLWWRADGGVGEAGDEGATPSVSLDVEGLERLVLVVSNLGPTGFDGDDDPYRGGDQRLTVDLDPAVDDTEPVDTGGATDTGTTDGGDDGGTDGGADGGADGDPDSGAGDTDGRANGAASDGGEEGKGCGCAASSMSVSGWPALLLLSLALARRQRSRRRWSRL